MECVHAQINIFKSIIPQICFQFSNVFSEIWQIGWTRTGNGLSHLLESGRWTLDWELGWMDAMKWRRFFEKKSTGWMGWMAALMKFVVSSACAFQIVLTTQHVKISFLSLNTSNRVFFKDKIM